MSSRDNLACRWFERVWNDRQVDAIAEIGAPDMKAYGADGVVRDPKAFAAFQRTMVAAIPDLHVDIRHCVQGGDRVAVQWVATGTHTGSPPGLPATGRRLELSGLTLVRLAGDRIAEGWDDYDYDGLMRLLQGR
jgi:steroid delta-isomerase-like uncharacterized protein